MNESQIIKIQEYQRSSEPLVIDYKIFNRHKVKLAKIFDIYNVTADRNKVNFSIKAKHWVGVLKISQYTIIVRPKIESAKFIHMLFDIDPEMAKFLGEITDQIGFDEGFFYGFIKKLIDEILEVLVYYRRKGYIQTKETGTQVKGKILITETVKSNLKGDFRITYQYDRFTYDNFLNQILKYTILFLEPIIYERFKDEIINILSLLSDVSFRRKLEPHEIDQINYDRFTKKYQKIHKICKMILLNNIISLSEGDFHFNCFYFNAWDIFEKFLIKILSERLEPKFIVSKNSYWKEKGESSWNFQKTQPDITIHYENKPILLLDAKYKMNPSQSDNNQAGNYIRRLLINRANIESRYRNCILVYPKTPETNFWLLTRDREDGDLEGGRVFRHSIDLSQIDDESYLDNWTQNIVDKFLSGV